MLERLIDLSEGAAYLRVQNEQLVIRRDSDGEQSAPLREVAVLVLSNPAITCTQSVLSGLARHGGMIIACDEASLPIGMMCPLAGHSTQGERFRAQAAAKLPLRKRAWQQIVRAKIRQRWPPRRVYQSDVSPPITAEPCVRYGAPLVYQSDVSPPITADLVQSNAASTVYQSDVSPPITARRTECAGESRVYQSDVSPPITAVIASACSRT